MFRRRGTNNTHRGFKRTFVSNQFLSLNNRLKSCLLFSCLCLCWHIAFLLGTLPSPTVDCVAFDWRPGGHEHNTRTPAHQWWAGEVALHPCFIYTVYTVKQDQISVNWNSKRPNMQAETGQSWWPASFILCTSLLPAVFFWESAGCVAKSRCTMWSKPCWDEALPDMCLKSRGSLVLSDMCQKSPGLEGCQLCLKLCHTTRPW